MYPGKPMFQNQTLRFGKGRAYRTPETWKFKNDIYLLAQSACKEMWKGAVGVEIVWTRAEKRGDIDGPIKHILDAMQGAVYSNDSQVCDVRVVRKDGDEDAVEITAWTLES